MEFSDVYKRYSDDIAVTALSQRVPGLDYDDVVSEMTACLWTAWKTYNPKKGSFGSYWWSLWLNRRNNITARAYRIKRPRTVVAGPYLPESRYLMDLMPHPPEGTTRKERVIWALLAEGMAPYEVMDACGLNRRSYYALIKRWRTPEIKGMLGGA